jgi:hypothetical protein
MFSTARRSFGGVAGLRALALGRAAGAAPNKTAASPGPPSKAAAPEGRPSGDGAGAVKS